MIMIIKIMRDEGGLSNGLFGLLFLACIVNIFLSLSLSGFVAGFILFNIWLIHFIKSKIQYLIPLFVIFIFILIMFQYFLIIEYEFFKSIRIKKIIDDVLLDPSFLLDTSFAHRFVHLYVGFLGLLQTYGSGFGAGTFTIIAPEVYINSGVASQINLNEFYTYACYETLRESPVSVMGLLMFEYGVFGLFLILYLSFKEVFDIF